MPMARAPKACFPSGGKRSRLVSSRRRIQKMLDGRRLDFARLLVVIAHEGFQNRDNVNSRAILRNAIVLRVIERVLFVENTVLPFFELRNYAIVCAAMAVEEAQYVFQNHDAGPLRFDVLEAMIRQSASSRVLASQAQAGRRERLARESSHIHIDSRGCAWISTLNVDVQLTWCVVVHDQFHARGMILAREDMVDRDASIVQSPQYCVHARKVGPHPHGP